MASGNLGPKLPQRTGNQIQHCCVQVQISVWLKQPAILVLHFVTCENQANKHLMSPWCDRFCAHVLNRSVQIREIHLPPVIWHLALKLQQTQRASTALWQSLLIWAEFQTVCQNILGSPAWREFGTQDTVSLESLAWTLLQVPLNMTSGGLVQIPKRSSLRK